ncbi:signal peptide peptidase SppA [Candidatus Woesearchaeota archaeon]|nr:signal peptide peptidase SppA [Candidatus Woesearchaeota archaeon]
MKKIPAIIAILFGLYVLSHLFAFFLSINTGIEIVQGNVALIPITGVISLSEQDSLFGESVSSADSVIKTIEKVDLNPNIKAIIFEINSPGGYPVATDEISQKIKSINKTTVAVIREIGASGAYWIASACDHVIANRMSVTGSIGVYGSYLEFSELLTRFNVTYRRFVAGDYKDLGSPYKDMSEEEQELYQRILNKLHEFFIKEVSENRGLSLEQTRELANGMIYLGVEAKELGLIDELGNRETAVKYLENKLNTTVKTTEFKDKKSIMDILGRLFSEPRITMGRFIYKKNNEPVITL